eukprot:6210686-Pleurochrysis_carterae.AAC.6
MASLAYPSRHSRCALLPSTRVPLRALVALLLTLRSVASVSADFAEAVVRTSHAHVCVRAHSHSCTRAVVYVRLVCASVRQCASGQTARACRDAFGTVCAFSQTCVLVVRGLRTRPCCLSALAGAVGHARGGGERGRAALARGERRGRALLVGSRQARAPKHRARTHTITHASAEHT